jgi:Kef-type K+ transport system membrane component KefB
LREASHKYNYKLLRRKYLTHDRLQPLLAGTALGPNGLKLVADVKATEILGELGIVFFLFEMGLELSMARLKAMRKDVFGLGLAQFFLTALGVAAVASRAGLAAPSLVVIGGGVALSSSAFVLQLLKDRDDMGTRYVCLLCIHMIKLLQVLLLLLVLFTLVLPVVLL